MVEGKKLNRKAFDERLIHRYLLETLYGVSGTRRGEKICKEMFKGKFSPSDVNIVMHEVSHSFIALILKFTTMVRINLSH